MTARTFPGGVYVPHYKQLTEDKEISVAKLPKEVIIPLHQHTGAPCHPLVKVGDIVKTGQKIGDTDAFVSASVHSSVDGVVTAVESRPYFTGTDVKSVVIEVAAKQEEPKWENNNIHAYSADELRQIVKEAGIVGMGGAAFPTHVKLNPPEPIDSVIINACECEPFLTCDHRVMIEMTDELIQGARLIRKMVNAGKIYFGVERNKPDAIEALQAKLVGLDEMEVVSLEVKYPQGSEKQLIKAILDREVPIGKLPFNVGVVMQNVGTAVAIYQAVKQRKPLIERVVTVSGDGIAEPGNVLVRIGTPVRDVIEYCGGFSGIALDPEVKMDPTEVRYPTYNAPRMVEKIIIGGPMTGFAQSTLDTSVVKGTTGILVFTSSMINESSYMDCVRCGRCLDHCPMGLYPNHIGTYSEMGRYELAAEWGALDCFECGVCAYICPSKRPIVHFTRATKQYMAQKREIG